LRHVVNKRISALDPSVVDSCRAAGKFARFAAAQESIRGAQAMTEIFLSYRADDSVHATMAISDLLAHHFGREHVFRDRDSLVLGGIYPRRIRRAVEHADVVLAIVGPHWLGALDGHGRRRIDDHRDWVRTELRMAFARAIRVIPVLLDEVALPDRAQLPDDIGLLCLSNYWRIRHESFDADVRGLIAKLDPAADGNRGDTGGPAAEERASRHNTQHNSATGGGTIYANQGTQNINVRPEGSGR
jgi:hypothetical protein